MPLKTTHPDTAKRLEEKLKEISTILNSPQRIDLWKLRGLAISEGGLVNDELRRQAWPKLVGIHERYWGSANDGIKRTSDASTVNTDATPKKSNVKHPKERRRIQKPRLAIEHTQSFDDSDSSSDLSLRDKVLASSLDFRQIELDVARCTWHLLTGTQRLQRLQMEYKRNRKVAKLIRRKQRRLANLINLTLVKSYKLRNDTSPASARDTTLRYYQGYHDVACIILSTLSGNAAVPLPLVSQSASLETIAQVTGLDLPACVLLQLSQCHFRDCMRANFNQLQTTMRLTLLPLIAYFDPALHDFLADCSMEPFFALSWIITWFSHDVRDTDLTKRLFDFFIASHPLMPFYVTVAMVCHPMNRQDVLQTECDFASVHQTLAALPRNSSMVGWKYQPGDGYVSDDEQSVNDDESFASQNSVDTEFILHDEVIETVQHDKIGAEAVSTVSSSMSTCYDARVPFQEIFDLAIVYMERLPPRSLPKLARRYFGRDFVQNLTKQAPGTFQPPPSWTTASAAKSDVELQREAKHLNELAASCEDDVEFHLQQSVSSTSIEADLSSQPRRFSDPIKQKAIVAAGISSKDDEQRRKRRNRLLFFGGAMAIVVVAVVWGAALQTPLIVDVPQDDFVNGWGEPETALVDKGQTLLAASVCWESTERPTLDKEIIFSMMLDRSEQKEIVVREIAAVPSPINDRGIVHRSLEHFDRVVDLLIDLVLKEALQLGARMSKIGNAIKERPIASFTNGTKAFASHLRAIAHKLRTNKTLAGFLLPVMSQFSRKLETIEPSLSENSLTRMSWRQVGNSVSSSVLAPSRSLNKHVSLVDSSGIESSLEESPLTILSRIVASECAGNPLCQNLLGLSSHLHHMQKAAIHAKNLPVKTLRKAVRIAKPAVTKAIGGVSLASYYYHGHEDDEGDDQKFLLMGTN